MKKTLFFTPKKSLRAWVAVGMAAVLGLSVINIQGSLAAACTPPSQDYGTLTGTITAQGSGTYKIWSRIKTPDTVNTSYQLEIDGTNCYVVGGNAIAPNTWTWVDYQDGTPSSKIQLNLAQGGHRIKMTGLKPGVKLDRIIAVTDVNCVPTGNGDNCNTPTDTTAPAVDINAPQAGSTLKDTAKSTATASDASGIQKVEFYANAALVSTDTATPYEANWDTTLTQNGAYTLTAKAYDNANNYGVDTLSVTVKNGDTQAPTAPSGLQAPNPQHNKVSLAWGASTDNVSVTHYLVTRNNAPLANVTSTSYADTTVAPQVNYNYSVVAVDAAGNKSTPAAITVVTPSIADTQAPSKPAGLEATATSPTQVNVRWTASTDNIGVIGYQVFRSQNGGAFTKVATVPGTSFADASLTALTKYSYYIKAVDATGNASENSNTAATQTHGRSQNSEMLGTVKDNFGKPIKGALISFTANNKVYTYATDSAGKYYIDPMPSGTFLVTYEAKGYSTETVVRPIRENARVAQSMTLQKR